MQWCNEVVLQWNWLGQYYEELELKYEDLEKQHKSMINVKVYVQTKNYGKSEERRNRSRYKHQMSWECKQWHEEKTEIKQKYTWLFNCALLFCLLKVCPVQ